MESTTALLAGLLVFASPATILDDWHWEARPILVFADESDPRLNRQIADFAAVADGLHERRNIVIVDTNAASNLRDRFEPEEFTVILIGLDGGEKARQEGPVTGSVFEDRIDAMPMRKRETDAE